MSKYLGTVRGRGTCVYNGGAGVLVSVRRARGHGELDWSPRSCEDMGRMGANPHDQGAVVLVDSERLSAEALRRLVEEFVSRNGTDYGVVERELGDKTRQVLAQIRRGEVLIVFDVESERCNLVTRVEWEARAAEP